MTTKEIKQLSKHKAKQEDTNINMEIILAVVGEFLENLEFLLLGSPNPLKRAAYFGVLLRRHQPTKICFLEPHD